MTTFTFKPGSPRAGRSSGRQGVESRWWRQAVLFAVVVITVLGAGVLHRLYAQRNLDNVEIKTEMVAGNIHVLFGAGGNIGVSAGADGLLMVDDQFAPLADKIRAALKELATGDLAFVLNTHWHFDHTDGNTEFGPEATIIAHDNVRQRLSTRQELLGRTREPAPPEAWPVVTFKESLTVHFNGEPIEVIHFPTGHTDGDSVIFFTESNVVHMGDDFFAGSFPFVDLESGGNVEGLTRNIGQVLERVPADVKIIPGHGPVSEVKDLRAYHDMLQKTTEIVRQRMKAGKSVEEIKEEGLPAEWDSWGAGFIKTDNWLETVYNSLS